MKRWILIVMLLAPFALLGQDDDPLSHRGVQFAAQGTDFWVCFPRTLLRNTPTFFRLYVVSERPCEVTVSNELIDYSQTYQIEGRRLSDYDLNYIHIPIQYGRIIDTVRYQYYPYSPQHVYNNVGGNQPQPRGFHVTSTDTISLFIYVASACSVLPTEMLSDEYVVQPPIVNDYRIMPLLPHFPPYTPLSSIDIVAVDDSTTVDIVLADWDWINRRPGDTVTVTLRRGELYHLGAGYPIEKYYPNFNPYWNIVHPGTPPPSLPDVSMTRHSFAGETVTRDTFAVDLTGTRIKARDCKRIAVFESSGICGSGMRGNVNKAFKMEQVVPSFYAGKEYLVPNLGHTIRFTALDEETHVTIRDVDHAENVRTLTIPAGGTDWWETDTMVNMYHITADKPVLAKWTGEGHTTLTPTRWWHGGQINYGTVTDVDQDLNVYPITTRLYIFARTADAPSFYMDSYPIGSYFQSISGTPYSCAYFDTQSQFNSMGTHHILSRTQAPFSAYLLGIGRYFIPLPHVQPGGVRLTVNGIEADSLKADSLWCVHDTVVFEAQNRRPCDSLLWDFGDGSTLAFGHDEEGFAQPQPHLFLHPGRITVRAIYKYADEGCLTVKPDTISATLDVRGDVDTTISVLLCEGSYFLRGHEMASTGRYEFTTTWPTGRCDTLWQIDFVTCPHCRWWYDTVATDDLPVTFNGITFNTEQHDAPIRLHINDTCDSIIYYTLIAIPNWGEKPIDSTWIAAPNVFTPTLESNIHFALTCSPHILQAEVTVFDRRGVRVAQFDGLSGSWDGNTNGSPCPQGTYVYYVRYIDTHDKAYKTLTGTVTLLR